MEWFPLVYAAFCSVSRRGAGSFSRLRRRWKFLRRQHHDNDARGNEYCNRDCDRRKPEQDRFFNLYGAIKQQRKLTLVLSETGEA